MDKKRAKKLIPILQAFSDGKEILGRSGEGYAWIDIDEEKFSNAAILEFWKLKIKPDPEVIYVNKSKTGKCYVYNSYKQATALVEGERYYEYIAKKFTEGE